MQLKEHRTVEGVYIVGCPYSIIDGTDSLVTIIDMREISSYNLACILEDAKEDAKFIKKGHYLIVI